MEPGWTVRNKAHWPGSVQPSAVSGPAPPGGFATGWSPCSCRPWSSPATRSRPSRNRRPTASSFPWNPRCLAPVPILDTSSVTTLRSRRVGIDLARLATVQAALDRNAGTAASLTLNLFDDAVFPAVVERTAPTGSDGYVLSGRLEGPRARHADAGRQRRRGGRYGPHAVRHLSDTDPGRRHVRHPAGRPLDPASGGRAPATSVPAARRSRGFACERSRSPSRQAPTRAPTRCSPATTARSSTCSSSTRRRRSGRRAVRRPSKHCSISGSPRPTGPTRTVAPSTASAWWGRMRWRTWSPSICSSTSTVCREGRTETWTRSTPFATATGRTSSTWCSTASEPAASPTPSGSGLPPTASPSPTSTAAP